MSDAPTIIETPQDPIVDLRDAHGNVLARYANGRVFFLGKPGNGTPSLGCRIEELPDLEAQIALLKANRVVRAKLEEVRP